MFREVSGNAFTRNKMFHGTKAECEAEISRLGLKPRPQDPVAKAFLDKVAAESAKRKK
jgi:hypothetical protein